MSRSLSARVRRAKRRINRKLERKLKIQLEWEQGFSKRVKSQKIKFHRSSLQEVFDYIPEGPNGDKVIGCLK